MTRIDVDGDDAADGLVALVVAVVELLLEAMQREALRRMEAGQLTDEEVERVGVRFAAIETEIADLKADAGVEDEVADLRGQLDGLVADAVTGVVGDDERPRAPGRQVGEGEDD